MISAIPQPDWWGSPRPVFRPAGIISYDRGREAANGVEWRADGSVAVRVGSVAHALVSGTEAAVMSARRRRRIDPAAATGSGEHRRSGLLATDDAQAQPGFRAGDGSGAGHDQAVDQRVQVKAAIDAVLGLGQVAPPVFMDIDVVVGPANGGLEIGDDGVHPPEGIKIAGLAGADHDRPIVGDDRRRRGQAREGVGDQMDAGVQGVGGPGPNGVAREIGQGIEADMVEVSRRVEFHRRDKQRLVLRTTPRFALMDAAQVRLVGHDHAGQAPPRLALGHGFHELVLDPPGGAIGNPEVAFERQRGDIVLVLADQVDRRKPGREGQFRAVKQGPRAQRRLCPTVRALPVGPAVGHEGGVLPRAAPRAHKAARPARLQQAGLALRLGAEALVKFAQGHAGLELDRILGHGRVLAGGLP